MSLNRFFRACPNCNKFFYDEQKFKNHECGKEMPEELKKYMAENHPVVSVKEDVPARVAEPVSDYSKHADQMNRRNRRKEMLKVLKEHGVDTTGLLTFTAVEEVYNKHFKDGEK